MEQDEGDHFNLADITLVDYGLGNIQAFANIYHRLNVSVDIASNVEELVRANRIILPGVGAFDWAMTSLNNSGMRDCLDELVLRDKKPILGVCVGMQMMAKSSEEGSMPGLGWVDADIKRLRCDMIGNLPLPHMGWNDVVPQESFNLFNGILSPRFYFLHDYFIETKKTDLIFAEAFYGKNFTVAIQDGNIYGTQFHPEKSHSYGISLLQNFANF